MIGAPIEWLLSATADLLLRLVPLRGEPAPVTDEEIGFMLREGVATGHIPPAETAIVEMALRLGDRRVSAVMTPRTQIEFLDLDDASRTSRSGSIRDSAYSRFPVVQGGTHQLAGIVQVKDLYDAALGGAAVRPARGAAPAAVPAQHGDGAARARSVQDSAASRWRWWSTNMATSKGW